MKNVLRKVLGLVIVTVFLSGCGEKQDIQSDIPVDEETQVVVKEGYHTVTFSKLEFEIPDAWDKWYDEVGSMKHYLFGDYDNYEAFTYACFDDNKGLTGIDLIKSQTDSLVKREEEKGVSVVVREGEKDGHATALCSYTEPLNTTKRRTTMFYVNTSGNKYIIMEYSYDEHVTPEHKEEFEYLLDSIRVVE